MLLDVPTIHTDVLKKNYAILPDVPIKTNVARERYDI